MNRGHDPINPSHYKKGDVECIEAIRASLTKEAFMGYLKGNALKYLWRKQKMAKRTLKKLFGTFPIWSLTS